MVYMGDLVILYSRPYSIYLRETIYRKDGGIVPENDHGLLAFRVQPRSPKRLPSSAATETRTLKPNPPPKPLNPIDPKS